MRLNSTQEGRKLAVTLHARFDAAASNDLDIVFRFQFDPHYATQPSVQIEPVESETFCIRAGRFSIVDEPPDVTLFVESDAFALQLIEGVANPIDAFMTGRFASDGYLMRVFGILRSFRSI